MDLIKHIWYLIQVKRQKERGNSISADVTDDTIENDVSFSYFQTICQLLWTFWYCRI